MNSRFTPIEQGSLKTRVRCRIPAAQTDELGQRRYSLMPIRRSTDGVFGGRGRFNVLRVTLMAGKGFSGFLPLATPAGACARHGVRS